MIARPEQGADNGGRNRRRRRLGLEAPVDDMGRAGELKEEQHRAWREDPFLSPHRVQLRGRRRAVRDRDGWREDQWGVQVYI